MGVYLRSGTSVRSTATGTTAGSITIDGIGGNGTNNNYGVYIVSNTTDVTSVDGAISIIGVGGSGSGDLNMGVYFNGIERIESTGTGANAATITITGTGGNAQSFNYGVIVLGNTATPDVTSKHGGFDHRRWTWNRSL